MKDCLVRHGAMRVAACTWGALLTVLGCGSIPSGETVDSKTEQALTVSGITLQTVLSPHFVGAQNNGGGAVVATATVAQAWETFTLIDVTGSTLQSGDNVFVQAGNGQFFQALNGGGSTLNAGSNNQLGWETFKVVKQSGSGPIGNGDIVGFQDSTGSWISAQNGGGASVFAYGGALGSWEQFRINGLPVASVGPTTVNGVSFRTQATGNFLGAQNDGGGAVIATATVAQAWETFSLLDVNGGSLDSGDSVFIRAGNGQYFQALNGGGSTLNAGSNNTLGWETFKVVRQAGGGTVQTGDIVGLQDSTGSWVSAQNGGGGSVFAYGGALGSWESLAIGIGSPASGPASGLGSILSQGTFDAMFPNRNGFYSYSGLLSAAATFGAFANTGDITAQKREVAAFLANVGQETGDLVYIDEIDQAPYCSSSSDCPCAPGKEYFGRGSLQISWNYNYCAAGAALGLDLRGNPDLVSQDATVAWRTGLWFWMTSAGAGARPAHDSIVDGDGFGETIRTINGSLECNGGNPDAVNARVGRYLNFCGMLGVDPGSNQGC
ncbi:MAG TPA: chitinase [Polyangiaceae bacterium]|jgi:predicted chitinase|nr:chitinase [Polyangiaceae bacterium]